MSKNVSEHSMDRPLVLKIIAAYRLIVAAFITLIGLIMVIDGFGIFDFIPASTIQNLFPDEPIGFITLIGLILLGLGVFLLFMAKGLWNLNKVVYWLEIILGSLILLQYLLGVNLSDLDILVLIFQLVNIAILVYLIMIRDSFRQTMEVTPYLYLLPSFFSLMSFVFFPLIFSFIMSLYENPRPVELRFAYDYYLEFVNISMTTLRRFLIADAQYVKGVLKVEGLYLLLTFVVFLTYIFAVYRKAFPKIGPINDLSRPIQAVLAILSGIIVAPLFIELIELIFVFDILDMIYTYITYFLSLVLSIEPSRIILPIEQYRIVLTAQELDFIRILFNTVFWTAACVFFHVVLGMFLAVIMNRKFTGQGFFRSVFILPWAIPSFVSTLVWRAFIFDSEEGFLGTLITSDTESFAFTLLDTLNVLVTIGIMVAVVVIYSKILDWDKLMDDTTAKKVFLAVVGIIIGIPISILTGLVTESLAKGLPSALKQLLTILVPFKELRPFFWTLADIIVLILPYLVALAIFIGIVLLYNAFLQERKRGEATYKPPLLLLGVAVLALPVGILSYSLLNTITEMLGLTGQSLLKSAIISIEEINPTFWFTDDIYIFGIKIKMLSISAIILNIWLGVPFMMVSFLAALQSIPEELYEAAEIDGASSWEKFWKITLPLLKPTLLTVSLLGIIWTFNMFNIVYLLSENQTGLGNSTYYSIFVTFIYERFTQNQYSRASALSFTIFLLLIVFSVVYRRALRAEKIFEAEARGEETS